MLLKCLCWVGGSQGVPFLTFTPNSYGMKVRIAKTQPQVGKEAPHFAVLSINIWPGNSFCEHNPVVSASEFFWLLGTAALKSWQAWIVASLPVSLKKKNMENKWLPVRSSWRAPARPLGGLWKMPPGVFIHRQSQSVYYSLYWSGNSLIIVSVFALI